MTDEAFEVGDRVFLTVTKHLGTVVSVNIQRRLNAPTGIAVRAYNIKLDAGGTIQGVYRGIERATSNK